jgi:hypothetical protein
VILAKELDPTQVSPGVPGFVVTFALALACWLLFRSLTTHLRRVSHSPEPTEPAGAIEVDDVASPVEDTTTEPAARTRGAARPKP